MVKIVEVHAAMASTTGRIVGVVDDDAHGPTDL